MEPCDLSVGGRVWINSMKDTSIGKGKIQLLEQIQRLGSLRQAAIDMKMSYQQAWNKVNVLNNDFEKPLVILQRGGKDGGKAEITEFGMFIIQTYHNLNDEFQLFLKQNTEILNKTF